MSKGQREADETLRKENAVALAIETLRRGATKEGLPSRVYRQGEWVPFLAVRRQGGAASSKQFENVAAPDDAVLHGTPVDVRLLFERRLLPALVGQVREASGKATKEATIADKPALLGRMLTARERQEMRAGSHARKASEGVLTCGDAWRLYGLPAPPQQAAAPGAPQQQKGLLSFFARAEGGGGGGGGGKAVAPIAPPAPAGGDEAAAVTPRKASADDGGNGGNGGNGGGALDEAVAVWSAEVARLEAERRRISAAAGHGAGDAPILCNLAAPLANATRLLEAARRKRARGGGETPSSAAR